MQTTTNHPLESLQGQLERVSYNNDENGYTVAKIKVYGREELVTIVGNMMNPIPGEIVKLKGEWGKHPQYGEQFKFVFTETTVPASVHGIEKYLGSGLIKGIGPVMAKRIVKIFKEKTLDVIETEIGRLTEVEGIGEKRIGMIGKAWEEQKEVRQVMIFLQDHGVSSGYAAKIYKQYGNESIKVVRENPYRLAMDIVGIGFKRADLISEKMGIPRDSDMRASAGLLYVLYELTDEGHVYYPHEPLVEKCKEMLGIDREIIVKAVEAMAKEERIVVEDSEDKAVYLSGYYTAEKNLAKRLRVLVNTPPSIRKIDADKAIDWLQGKLSIRLADKQVEAIRCAARSKVMVIKGGPGVGKTTIINAVIKIFSAIKTRILLAAPTGRAAKRMSEATGHEAKTIHRLLDFAKGGFKRNEENPLDCDLLIVDESSMIDTLLMNHLLKAIPPSSTFIMVGDSNQLEAVGAGNVLRDIIDSQIVPVVELNEIFRQAKTSSIIVNAHAINSGVVPNLKATQEKDKLDDFYFIEQEDPERARDVIIGLVRDRIPKRFGFDSFDDIQVLSPMRRGVIGATMLNQELQKALNPGDNGLTRGGRTFKIKDKVMQIRNNYDKEVYNGDIGRITAIDTEAQEVTVSMDGRAVTYDYTELDEIVHAYAVSVHKSQGSEYPCVVIPILTQHYMMLQRNLLYTGVTRGKKLVVIVGTKKAMSIAVRSNKAVKRYTRLKERLAVS